jgi:predicted RNase H-like nuclease (RuvC/YqgF family)
LKKYLIIGIDPGNTIAIAALDLGGGFLKSISFEHGGISKTVAEIEKLGTPSIIATDVTPAPEFALKLSSYFNARLYVPPKDVREDEKRAILKSLRISVGNSEVGQNAHERDAITAALKAYRFHQNSLRSILALAQYPPTFREHIAHHCMQGLRKEEAISLLNKTTQPKSNSKQAKEQKQLTQTKRNVNENKLLTLIKEKEQLLKKNRST